MKKTVSFNPSPFCSHHIEIEGSVKDIPFVKMIVRDNVLCVANLTVCRDLFQIVVSTGSDIGNAYLEQIYPILYKYTLE